MIGPREREQRSRPLLRTMVGEVLRRTRLEQGRTLADVARAARVSMPYLSEMERGRKEASSEVLAAICDALRIELSDLLAEVGRDLADDRARRLRSSGWTPSATAAPLGRSRGPGDIVGAGRLITRRCRQRRPGPPRGWRSPRRPGRSRPPPAR